MNFLGVRSSRRTPSALRARAPGRSRGAPLEAPRATPHRRRSGPRALGSARAVRRPRASGGRGHRAPAPRRMPRLTRRRRSGWRPPPRAGVRGAADPSVSAEHSALSWRCAPRRARREPVDDTAPRSRPRPAASRDRARSIAQRPTSRRNKPNMIHHPPSPRGEPSSSSRVCARTKKAPAAAPPPPDSNCPLAPVRATHRVRSSPRAATANLGSLPRRGGGPLLRRRPSRRSLRIRATPRCVDCAAFLNGYCRVDTARGQWRAASAAAITRTRRSPPGREGVRHRRELLEPDVTYAVASVGERTFGRTDGHGHGPEPEPEPSTPVVFVVDESWTRTRRSRSARRSSTRRAPPRRTRRRGWSRTAPPSPRTDRPRAPSSGASSPLHASAGIVPGTRSPTPRTSRGSSARAPRGSRLGSSRARRTAARPPRRGARVASRLRETAVARARARAAEVPRRGDRDRGDAHAGRGAARRAGGPPARGPGGGADDASNWSGSRGARRRSISTNSPTRYAHASGARTPRSREALFFFFSPSVPSPAPISPRSVMSPKLNLC